MRKSALLDWLATETPPLSRLELWLGIVTMYLALSAYLMGMFARYTGAAERARVIPITDRADRLPVREVTHSET